MMEEDSKLEVSKMHVFSHLLGLICNVSVLIYSILHLLGLLKVICIILSVLTFVLLVRLIYSDIKYLKKGYIIKSDSNTIKELKDAFDKDALKGFIMISIVSLIMFIITLIY
jgi:hypothetical protein